MKNLLQTKSKLETGASLLLAGIFFLGGCSPLQPVKSTDLNTYALDVQFTPASKATGDLTLLVNTPSARSGYDSARMIYLKKPHEIEYFLQNQWVDNPARMLAPLLVQAIESTAKYRAVITGRSAATADLRLDTEIIRLQHEFLTQPSQVHITVRVQLLDLRNKAVLATREFDLLEVASSDDPYGGVLATNRAVTRMLPQIAEFCIQGGKAGNN